MAPNNDHEPDVDAEAGQPGGVQSVNKLRRLTAEVAKPVDHFAKWQHPRRIRTMATAN